MSYQSVINTVCGMVNNGNATTLAGNYGLNVMNVTWEDNGRSKNSCWGPCISDMTLNVENHRMPVIRTPNYEDVTWDIPMENIPVLVGNEHDETLRRMSLKDYLMNFRDYLHNPSSWTGQDRSLYAEERDSHVIVSSQACFLPIPCDGGEAKFNVALSNYQSHAGHPAILAIVATSNGTSAQIVDNWNQNLYFNKNGERCSFIGQRLSEYRENQGLEDTSGPMTQEEKEQNMILIIQVPLVPKPRPVRKYKEKYSKNVKNKRCIKERKVERKEVDVEDAIIQIGEAEGVFREVGNMPIRRDPTFPVRVTLQYYKATSNGEVNNEVMGQIYEQLCQSRNYATNIGSLVVGGVTDRPTEFINAKYGGYDLPIWWNEFWLMYKNQFTQFTEVEAKNKVFINGRFCTSTLNECKSQVLSILGGGSQDSGWGFFM